MGGEVRFLNSPDTGWVSSMTVPFWNDLSLVPHLELPKPGSFWHEHMTRQLELFAEACRGKYGCSHFICINSLNLLFELRGATNSYNDLIDNTETTHEFLNFAVKLNRFVQDAYFDKIGLYEGGTVSNMLQWAPGRIISDLFLS